MYVVNIKTFVFNIFVCCQTIVSWQTRHEKALVSLEVDDDIQDNGIWIDQGLVDNNPSKSSSSEEL